MTHPPSVFLATTALSEFWDLNARLLFLGRWCLRHDRSTEWAHLDYEMLPSAWTDRERFERAARYLDDASEVLLLRVGDYLNAVHGRSASGRYWRVVLGNWLGNYLHVAYDRYVHLCDAFARHPDLWTIVMDADCCQVPHDTHEMAYRLKRDDRGNLQFISHLLLAMGYRFESRQPHSNHHQDRRRGGGSLWNPARLALRLAENVAHAIAASGPNAVLSHMEIMDNAQMWRLALASRFRIVPMGARPPVERLSAVFDDRRLGLGSLAADDPFQRAAVTCLPHYLPTVFLEGYEATRRRALLGWRRLPKVIVSATGWNYDEEFKLFAAEAGDAGCRLVAVQHGGNYGYARESPAEVLERRLSDTFVTWGWADGSSTGLRNLPNPKLSQFILAPRRRSGGDGALFVATMDKRYVVRLHSSPFGTLADDYFHGQLRFLGALSKDVRRLIRLRPYPGSAHPLKRIIAEKYGDVGWDEGDTLYQSLVGARLVLIDNPATSMLEALGADIPTVLFWDRRHWEMRSEAEPYFESLRAAGILHDSPEAAAAHFTTVVYDVEVWWQGPAVQQARRAFVRRFALTDRDWPMAWLAGIDAEVAAAGAGAGAR